MAVVKHPPEHQISRKTAEDAAHEAQREAILDVIVEDARRIIDRFEAVRVYPVCERALHLLVHELSAIDEVAVKCDPTHPHRAGEHFHDELDAFLESFRTLDHLDLLPRWDQAVERAWRHVPVVESLGTDRNFGLLIECLHGDKMRHLPNWGTEYVGGSGGKMTKFDTRKNELMLRRRRKLVFSAGRDKLPLTYVATALRNIEALGFGFTGPAIERMCSLSEREFLDLYQFLAKQLRKMVGADRMWAPMYPNFPQQVMDAPAMELYVNALMHYLGDWFGVRIMPDYEKRERPPLADKLELDLIDLATDEEVVELGRQLMSAKSSISPQDRSDLIWFVRTHAVDIERILPTELPHKENLATIAMLLMEHTAKADLVLTPYFRTATDVLRLATAMSQGDVSLAAKSQYRSFKRAERRLLLAMLERIDEPLEDMRRHHGKWKRLGERLHPGEHRARYPKAAAAFDALRNDEFPRTFNSHVEEHLAAAVEDGEVVPVLRLLGQRPGEFARRLDHVLRLCHDTRKVTEAFADVAGEVSTAVLLQMRAHFGARAVPAPLRAFFPKGNVARVFTIPNDLPPIPAEVCDDVAALCGETLEARFAQRAPLGRVFVDPALEHCLVPFSQRSASKALRTIVRGSRLDLPDGDTVRFFLWWKEGKRPAGTHTGRVDIDLSAVMYDTAWRYKEHVSYTNLRSATYRSAHSGDITSAPDGACEFIDLDLPSVAEFGGRYVVMSVNSFTGQPFATLPECYAGWMMRQEPGSGEAFEPATVTDRLDLTADTRISIPVILDLVERTMYWADLALRSHPNYAINIESNERGLVHMGLAITTLVKPNLRDLFEMHARARGELTQLQEDADVVFGPDTAFEIEKIVADYL